MIYMGYSAYNIELYVAQNNYEQAKELLKNLNIESDNQNDKTVLDSADESNDQNDQQVKSISFYLAQIAKIIIILYLLLNLIGLIF